MTTSTEVQVKVGDFFVESWGYDQTNVDHYQVTRVSDTGKTIWMRHVASKAVDDHGNHVVPVTDAFDAYGYDKSGVGSSRSGELKKRVRHFDYGNGPSVSVHMTSYSNAYLWDGNPDYRTGPYEAGH